jgi:predicted transcriptional regulator
MRSHVAVSLRVPDDLKQRIAELAREQETTPHAFMLEAIREKLASEEARRAFHAEASRRLARMKKSGAAIPADEVFAYFQERGTGGTPERPKARKLR